MRFHYRKIVETMKFCPQVIAVGPPSTGPCKPVYLHIFGANNSKTLYNACTRTYLLQCCAISTIPFGIDDPNIAGDIGDIIISLHNATLQLIVTLNAATVCEGNCEDHFTLLSTFRQGDMMNQSSKHIDGFFYYL